MAIFKVFESFEDNQRKIVRENKRRKIKESYVDDLSDIRKMAVENGYLADMVESLQYSNMLEETDKGWAYMRSDYSGRDYFNDIPLEYINEDEAQEIADYCLLDSGLEDYDWGEFSDGQVLNILSEQNFVDLLIDYLNGSLITESKERRNIREAKEEHSDKTDLKTLLIAVKTALDYFDYHNKNLTKQQDYVLEDLKDVYEDIKRKV